jgi:hypothetical protein
VREVLHQKRGCPGLEGTNDLDIAGVRGQDDDAGVRKLAADGGDGVAAAHHRHLQIH